MNRSNGHRASRCLPARGRGKIQVRDVEITSALNRFVKKKQSEERHHSSRMENDFAYQ